MTDITVGGFLKDVFNLSDKCILITGASSGIGMHLATTYAKCGAKALILAARRLDRLENLKKEFAKSHPNMKVCIGKCDVSSIQDVKAVFDKAETELGLTVNVLVNNAGVLSRETLFSMTEESFDRMLAVNLKPAYFVTLEAATRFKESTCKGELSVINISSALPYSRGYGSAHYGSTKMAMNHATKALQYELIHFAGPGKVIRVNALSPGVFKTEINNDVIDGEGGKILSNKALGKRIGKLEELNGAALLLASDAGSFMLGTNIFVDGGESLRAM